MQTFRRGASSSVASSPVPITRCLCARTIGGPKYEMRALGNSPKANGRKGDCAPEEARVLCCLRPTGRKHNALTTLRIQRLDLRLLTCGHRENHGQPLKGDGVAWQLVSTNKFA